MQTIITRAKTNIDVFLLPIKAHACDVTDKLKYRELIKKTQENSAL